jgi:hypothetical protein
MPIPERQKGEPKDKFLGDCIAELVTKGHENDQAAAICYQQMDIQLMNSREWRKDFTISADSKLTQILKKAL